VKQGGRLVGDAKCELALHPNGESPLLLVPNELLDALPVALDPSEIDNVKAFNDRLRTKFNELFCRCRQTKTPTDQSRSYEKSSLAPGGLQTLVEVCRRAAGRPYDSAMIHGARRWE